MSRGFKEEGSIGEGNGGEVSEADFLRIKKQKINRLTDRQKQQIRLISAKELKSLIISLIICSRNMRES